MSLSDLSQLRINREATSAPPRRLLPIILGVVAIAAVVGITAFVKREQPFDVQTTTAAVRGGAGGSGGLTANGYIVARTKASVSSKIPGRLAFLAVEEGDRVRAGDIIARLEAAEYEAIVSQANAEVLSAEASQHEAAAALEQAQRALTRARELAATSLVSAQTREDAETAVKVAEARLAATTARIEAARQGRAAAIANLENTRVRAPFTGTVLRKDAEVGEVVAPSVGGGLTRGAVVTMADMSTLEVEVDVNEAYIGGIRQQQPAQIVLDAYPSVTFAGHVRQIVPTADRQKATVLVRVAFDSIDNRVLPEMGARVVFTEEAAAAAATPSRVFVPTAAIRTEADATVVYRIVDEHARRVVIEAGPVSGGEREVRSGLAGGEVLILDPPAGLTDGARVRVATTPNRQE